MFYQIAFPFYLQSLRISSLRFIERCFVLVYKTSNFPELNLDHVCKILSSSELYVTTEVEVIKAAEKWMEYKVDERIKFSKNLLLKIRFPLFSNGALPIVISEDSYFYKDPDSAAMLKKIIENKNSFYQNKCGNYRVSRYCSQKSFNFLISESINKKIKNYLIEDKKLRVVKELGLLKAITHLPKSVYCNGALYFLNDTHGVIRSEVKRLRSIEKYCLTNNTWQSVCKKHDDRIKFSLCALMDQVFIFGGCFNYPFDDATATCLRLDTKSHEWSFVAEMSVERYDSACVVFQESIVVSGGDDQEHPTDSVEAYDHVTGTWSPMPRMTKERSNHGLVVVKNKLYAIGGDFDDEYPTYTSEVYDSCSKMFVKIANLPRNIYTDLYGCDTFASGNRIMCVNPKNPFYKVADMYYDVEKEKWFEFTSEMPEVKWFNPIFKVPQIYIDSS